MGCEEYVVLSALSEYPAARTLAAFVFNPLPSTLGG